MTTIINTKLDNQLTNIDENIISDMKAMYSKFGFLKTDFDITKLMQFRSAFLKEELDELYEAMEICDSDGIVDALIDLTVISVGTLLQLGVDVNKAWKAVHDANNSKVVGDKDGRNNLGIPDLKKPEGWKAPDHNDNIGYLDSMKPVEIRESVKVLQECIDLQLKKSMDYQNPKSTVKQADYYRKGLTTIFDIIHAKYLRMKSLIETLEQNPDMVPEFESLEDSAKDLINYASFFVAYSRGKIPGQSINVR
jgi:hypothetical protein